VSEIQTIEPLLLSAAKAAHLLGISRAHFYSMHSSGTLGPQPMRLGGRVLWSIDELKRWVDADCPQRQKWVQIRRTNNV